MAKKIPVPRAKTKMGFLDKLFMGIGGLSPYFGKARLHQSMSKATESGRAARAAQRAAMIAKYGKGAMRVGRFAGLMNPWTAVPYALLAGAQYGVKRAFAPYKDAEGKWTKEGLEQMSQARMEREERTRANAAVRGEVSYLDDPEFRMWGNEGGLAGLL